MSHSGKQLRSNLRESGGLPVLKKEQLISFIRRSGWRIIGASSHRFGYYLLRKRKNRGSILTLAVQPDYTLPKCFRVNIFRTKLPTESPEYYRYTFREFVDGPICWLESELRRWKSIWYWPDGTLSGFGAAVSEILENRRYFFRPHKQLITLLRQHQNCIHMQALHLNIPEYFPAVISACVVGAETHIEHWMAKSDFSTIIQSHHHGELRIYTTDNALFDNVKNTFEAKYEDYSSINPPSTAEIRRGMARDRM